MKIDLVYTWVDGSDPQWRAKHDAVSGVATRPADNCKGRYFNNDELRFSLRSVAKYAPWINHVYIVTDGQTPDWLDTSNPKVTIVDHSEILPPEARPCFNAFVIEHCLHKIPGLSEHWLYANDDMFINRPVRPDDFFAPDGFPIIRSTRGYLREATLFFKEKIIRHKVGAYPLALRRSARLVSLHRGTYFNWDPHHNIDAYLKSDYAHAYATYAAEVTPTLTNHLRRSNDLSRVLVSFDALARGRGHLQYVGRDVSFRLRLHRTSGYEKMRQANPMFFCANDSEHCTDEHRLLCRRFLEARYPLKSEFEK